MSSNRTYHTFTHKEAVFRICSDKFDLVTNEIINQRQILEDYISRHPEFQTSLKPVKLKSNAPESARRMAAAANLSGIGPMAAVAGTMAQLAGIAALKAGSPEVIIENGGDIFLKVNAPITIGLYTGTADLGDKLAFSLQPDDTPIAICSSSGRMGHSMSLGRCDLATVIARDTALADAAATLAANHVNTIDDIDSTLEAITQIAGIDGVLIVQNDRIGLAGKLPPLVKLDK